MISFVVAVVMSLAININTDAEARNFGPVQPRFQVNLNSVIDGVLTSIKTNASLMGLEPFHLPDMNETFSWSLFSGGLTLTQGQVHNITSIYRQGDVFISLNGSEGDVSAYMGFSELDMTYNFAASLLGIGPSGLATGKVTKLEAKLEAIANLANITAVTIHVKSLTLTSATLTMHLDGPIGIINTILDAIADVLIGIFRRQLDGLVAMEVLRIANNQLANSYFDFSNFMG